MTDKKTFDETVSLLLPYMSEISGRRALVESALFGCRILSSLDWSGSPHVFTVQLVRTLLNFGQCEPGHPAIVMLLEEVWQQSGHDKHPLIERLIQTYFPSNTGETPMIPAAAGWTFLFEIARWAKDELSQIWKYRREQQTQAVEIAQQTPDSPELQQVWTDMISKRSESEVKRLLKLITDQKDLILKYEQSKANARQQAIVDGNEMLLQNRLQHFDEQIEISRKEMRKQAEKLGIEITE